MIVELPRSTQKFIARDSRFRAKDCADFDANVTARRPMRPPPVRLAEHMITAAQLEAKRDNARATGHVAATLPRDDVELEAETEDILRIVEPR
jgi:hypothetical protein